MLLAIDVGNTGVKLGVFEGDKLRATWRMATSLSRMADEYASLLLTLLEHQGIKPQDIESVAMGSVVPPMVGTLKELFQRYFEITPFVVESGVKTGVRIRMDNPKEVGADRIINAAAARQLYGAPAIIVDLGTATTFDVLSAEGDYIGGCIAPGLITGAEALFARASKLPRVELTRPKRAIGSNTVTAMQSGIIFGYVGLIEGIVARLHAEIGAPARVIATGGFAEIMAKETATIDTVDSNLTLMGLRLIYLMNKTKAGGDNACL
jgi:type III pantothenate kinase